MMRQCSSGYWKQSSEPLINGIKLFGAWSGDFERLPADDERDVVEVVDDEVELLLVDDESRRLRRWPLEDL